VNGNLSEPLRQSVEKRLSVEAEPLAELFSAPGKGNRIQVEEIHLPWNRLFEVGFTVKVE
jgi:hypothetical protein